VLVEAVLRVFKKHEHFQSAEAVPGPRWGNLQRSSNKLVKIGDPCSIHKKTFYITTGWDGTISDQPHTSIGLSSIYAEMQRGRN